MNIVFKIFNILKAKIKNNIYLKYYFIISKNVLY